MTTTAGMAQDRMANPENSIARRHGAAGRARVLALSLAMGALAGCSTIDRVSNAITGGPSLQPGQAGYVQGFLGNVAAEEPRAALVARDVLSAGGSAADAAVAAGFALTVTLPSRAGLGGGGACLGYDPRRNEIEAFLFQPGAREGVPRGADRPAAIPMMARGLFALHARQGRLPFERTIAPAEGMARFGTPVSRALSADLAAVAGPLMADPVSRAVFAPGGNPIAEGAALTQQELASTLSSIRTAGVGDLHQGGLARRVEEGSRAAGGFLTVAEMRNAVPQAVAAAQERVGSDVLATLPASVDGGATLAAFRATAAGSAPPVVAGNFGASTSLVVQDRDGGAVACAFTMNNLFGTGRMVPGMGFLLAPAPGMGGVQPVPLGAVLLANLNVKTMRYAGAGSGQGAAPAAAGGPAGLHLGRRVPLAQAIASGAPEPGRGVAVSCQGSVRAANCSAVADARGFGVSTGND
ncbi:gamma-glutamyltransferase [Pararoseomonas indoligenes]|uniref:Gamma-glutamyltransferase n=1 Tax=Roseomonas indoligenes TaxID=2820811 RepID=A0A940MUJ5_9PROT|nr:gamma-glutamyltransferase [Pararoseomonas indoligenes]MBP0491507.1 gamma-glutamyltransferase [Pararoseomonas indoligenes]